MHVDARAEVGEIGRIIEVGGGANDQLVRGGHWIVVRRARVCFGVARGGHDDHLRFKKSVVCLGDLLQLTAGFWLAWVLLLAALRRRVSLQGDPPKKWCLASSNMLRAFALSSAASSPKKPPESERCTTCTRVVDGLRRLTYTHGGGTVPSQGMCTQGFRDCFSGFVKHRGSSRLWNP